MKWSPPDHPGPFKKPSMRMMLTTSLCLLTLVAPPLVANSVVYAYDDDDEDAYEEEVEVQYIPPQVAPLRGPDDEASRLVTLLEQHKWLVEPYLRNVRGMESSLRQFASSIPEPGREDGPSRPPMTSPPTPTMTAPNLTGAMPTGIGSVQNMLFSALYDVVSDMAKQEVINYLIVRLSNELCSEYGGMFTHTCSLTRTNATRRVGLNDLHNTVRQDLYALPRQAITSLELKPVVKCGLELAVTLREQAESPYALASLLGAYTDTLSQNACRDAFAAGGINQSSVAALRLLGASYRPGDSADMLVKNVQARVLEHVRPGEPDSDGLDAAEKKLRQIDMYLWETPAGSMQPVARPVPNRAMWMQRSYELRTRIDAHREKRQSLRATLERDLERVVTTELNEILPLHRVAMSVVSLANIPVADEPELRARAAFRGATDLVIDTLPVLVAGGLSADDSSAQQIVEAIWLTRDLSVGNYRSGMQRLVTLEILDRGDVEVFNLVASVATARSEAEIRAALNTSLESRDTWETRRMGPMFGLTAQFGAAVAAEQVSGNDDYNAMAIGLSVPVGVDVSWPLFDSSSFGLMLQLVDLGAMGTARLGGEGPVDGEPRLGIVQLFAPGARAYVGLGDTPFVLAAWGDYVPALRSEKIDGIERSLGVMRFGVSVAVDVPLWTM